MKKLLIYGAGGNGKVYADIARLAGYEDILFFDDDININHLFTYQIIHNFDDIDINEYDFINAIGSNKTRQLVNKRISLPQISLIHPTAIIGENVIINQGCAIMANAVINPGSRIGEGVIVNTCASVDHDNIIEDYCHISVNAHTAGSVHLGKRVFCGMNSAVINNIVVCDDAVIAAGATVVKDITEAGTYIGTPARLKK